MKTNKLALLSAMAYTFSCDISRYYGASKQREITTPVLNTKRVPAKYREKPLQEYRIQGHYVFAYSRKDAIKRLKHQKKI